MQSHCWLTFIVSVLAVAQCLAGAPFGERDRQPHGRDWRASIGVCLPVSGPSLGARSVEGDGLAAAALSRARQLRLHLLDSAFDIRLLPVPAPRRDRSGTLPLASRPPPLV